MSAVLVEFEIGVSFMNDEGYIRMTGVWYIVAHNINEACDIINVHKGLYYEKHYAPEPTDFEFEFLQARAVNQVTWEPIGEGVQL